MSAIAGLGGGRRAFHVLAGEYVQGIVRDEEVGGRLSEERSAAVAGDREHGRPADRVVRVTGDDVCQTAGEHVCQDASWLVRETRHV